MAERPQSDSNSPAYECAEYRAQLEDLEIVRDLRAGTPALRKKGERYLPLEPEEEERDYRIRLSRAVLFNAYDRAVRSMTGMIFRRELRLEDDVPAEIRGTEAEQEAAEVEGIAEAIDAKGAHLTVFVKELTDAAIAEGHVFLYVDMPPVLPAGARLEDQRAAGLRPYWVQYAKDQAINWRMERGRLTQITFKEITKEPDGLFGEKVVTRYRVLWPGGWQIWIEQKSERGETVVVPEMDADGNARAGVTPFDEIPVAVVNSSKHGLLCSTPKLLDLAMINLLHYAESSDYRLYLHICSRPIPWMTGYDKPVMHVGPYSFFKLKDGGRLEFAESTGSALGAVRTDLQDLQEHMALLSLSMLAANKPSNTATEEILDSVKEESDLMTVARSVKDGVELALKWTAQYLEASKRFNATKADLAKISGGSVDLGSKMEDLVLPPEELRVYNEMAGRIFSTRTVRRMVAKARKEILPGDYDETREEADLRAEQAAAGLQAQDLGAAALAAFDRGEKEPLPPAERTPDDLAKLVVAAGALIRSGFEPQAALSAVGLDPIRHLGLLPVTVQTPE